MTALHRIAYLGPAGTFSEEALRAAAGGAGFEPVPAPTIAAAIAEVHDGSADIALVPIENSIEGSVRSTLDALAPEQIQVEIVGEYAHVISPSLLGFPRPLDEITDVFSHPQPIAQCSDFLIGSLPSAARHETASTSEGASRVGENPGKAWAAIGPSTAAPLYGLSVLAEGIANATDNVTRFVWVAPADGASRADVAPGQEWRTTLVFAELGEDHPGALVDALGVFADRGVNLTRIESRPALANGSGNGGGNFTRYMFFADLEGSIATPVVEEAIAALSGHADWVKVLGSYPVGVPGLPAVT